MKYFELNNQEKKILKDFEGGKLKLLKTSRKRYQNYAKNSLKKTKNINIRVNEAVLLRIKSMAVKEGMPYQTLISSWLHKLSV